MPGIFYAVAGETWDDRFPYFPTAIAAPVLNPWLETVTANGGVVSPAYLKAMDDELITPLINAGLWTIWDRFYLAGRAPDEASSLVDLVTGAKTLTKVGSPVFTAGLGWSSVSDGSGNVLEDTYIVPSGAQNNFSAFAERLNTQASASSFFGNGNTRLVPYNTASPNAATFRINAATPATVSPQSNATGLFGVSRVSASSQRLLRNGVSLANDGTANTSATPDGSAWRWLGAGGTGANNGLHTLGMCFLGDGVTTAQAASVQTIIDAFNAAIAAL